MPKTELMSPFKLMVRTKGCDRVVEMTILTSCPGSDGQFTIRRNLWLGGEDATDVFQLRLQHPGKPDEVVPEDAAVSIAIALRTALAQDLGVENQEIGWTVQNEPRGWRRIPGYLSL